MYSLDVSEQNFQQEVVDRSHNVPVVVDFWAPWCGPCQVLKPLLEALAEEFQGRFILAKVNADDNQALASQYSVRSIPSVKAFSKGQIINEFSGVLPEAPLREFINQLVPSESELKRLDALEHIDQGDHQTAESLLAEALNLDPENYEAIINQAQLKIENKDFDVAQQLLAQLPINIHQDEKVKALLAKIDMGRHVSALPDKDTLLKRIADNGDDLQALLDLANLNISSQCYDEAMDNLFAILEKNRADEAEAARKTLLSLFTLLGNQDSRVRAARKKLASLLN